MKLCILQSSYEGSSSPFKDCDMQLQITPFLSGHTWEQHALLKTSAVRQIHQLAQKGFDVFINFCDGAWDEDRAGVEVVQALEKLNLPFTGAGLAFYEPSREMMKRVCHHIGVSAPRGLCVESIDGLEQAVASLQFPLIVKHPNSYGSVGLTKQSRVTTFSQLQEQVAKMVAQFDGALVEEFIEGREFTALVVENAADPAHPYVYNPAEYHFPCGETFRYFDMKWNDLRDMTCTPCADPQLGERMQEASARFFAAIGGTGYARCDMRVTAEGEIFMLEINPNCGIFYDLADPGSADVILLQYPNGHADFLERLIQAAFRRRVVKTWKVALGKQGRYGLYAVRALAPGELIEAYEEKAHALVSRDYVQRNWDSQQQAAFARYAYPITDETWVVWSSDPAEWKPLNHSCDPNAWLEGLNLAARRAIAPGEEITLDFATLMNEVMPDFECRCGAANCRGTIRGTDYLAPFVAQYGEHTSDYVRTKRQQSAR